MRCDSDTILIVVVKLVTVVLLLLVVVNFVTVIGQILVGDEQEGVGVGGGQQFVLVLSFSSAPITF